MSLPTTQRTYPLPGKVKKAQACDPGQNGSIQGRGEELSLARLVVPVEHDVHGADLGQVVVLAVQPQDLLATLGFRCLLGHDGGCVVAVRGHKVKGHYRLL